MCTRQQIFSKTSTPQSQRFDDAGDIGFIENNGNKKVLLCERKRHTARRVASTRYADLSGGTRGTPPSSTPGEGGTPSTPGQVVSHPDLIGVPQVPPHHPDLVGVPQVPPPTIQTWDSPDLRWGTPPPSRPGMGYLPYLDLGWGTPLSRPGMGYPPT